MSGFPDIQRQTNKRKNGIQTEGKGPLLSKSSAKVMVQKRKNDKQSFSSMNFLPVELNDCVLLEHSPSIFFSNTSELRSSKESAANNELSNLLKK